MQQINLSVLIPMYGVEKYIERFARSMFEQTMTNGVEFIFIDDCSIDNSISVLKKVIADYPHLKDQIRIERLPKNMGLLGARLAGLKMANGEYIICNDSDDWVEPTMLEGMYNKAVSENCDVVIADYFEEYGERTKNRCQRPDNLDGKKCMNQILSKGLHGSWCNKLFKRELVNNKNILKPEVGMNVLEDLMMTAQLLFFAKKVGYLNKAFYHYCIRSGSTLYTLSETKFRSTLYAYDFIEKFYETNNITDEESVSALRTLRITTLAISALEGHKYNLIDYTKYKYLKPYIMKHRGLTRSYKLALWLRVSNLNPLLKVIIFVRNITKK